MQPEFNIDLFMTCGHLLVLTSFFNFFKKPSDFFLSQGYPIEGRMTSPQKGAKAMKHQLKISVSKEPQIGGIVSCRNVSIHERLLRFLFGNKRKVTVLIPGDSIGEITICETGEGEDENEQNQAAF